MEPKSESHKTGLFQLALPIIGTQILWMSMPFVDNIIVGRLGAKELAALGISSTYYTFLLVTTMGVLSAVNPMVSHAYGAQRYKDISDTLYHGFILALLCTFAFWGFIRISPSLLKLLGQNSELIEIGYDYLSTIAWGVPAQCFFLLFRQYSEAVGFPKPVVALVFIGAIANVFLVYGFVNGYGFIPAFGVAGAGYATSLVNWFLLFGMILVTFFHPRFQSLNIWRKFCFKLKLLKELFLIGLPSAGSLLAEVGYFCGSTWLAGTISNEAIASHQIALNISSMTFMIPLGFSLAASVKVGHCLGANQWDELRTTIRKSYLCILGVGICNAILLFFFRTEIARLYTSDKNTILITVGLLLISGVFQIFDGLQVLGIHLLRGFKDTKIPFINSVLAYWVIGTTLSVTLCFPLKRGVAGIWLGMILALATASLIHAWRLRVIYKRAIGTLSG